PSFRAVKLIQIKKGASNTRYPHQRNQTGFAGETCASSPIVLAQYLKIALDSGIANDGTRRSIRSAAAIIVANKIHPARRSRPKSARGFSTKLATNRMRKSTSGS